MRLVAEQAVALFGIEPVSISLIEHFDNTTFGVGDSGGIQYVLHILQQHDNATTLTQRRVRVESEMWWLGRVRADLHLSVPVAVHTPTGEVVVTVEDIAKPLLCTLFHRIDGRFLYHGLRPSHLKAVGRLTARLHKYSTHLRVPPGFERPGVDAADAETEERITRLFVDHVSREAANLIRGIIRRSRRAQDELGAGPEVFGLIHADIHQKNYLFKDGEVRLIDFGDCGWGHFLYDLAVTNHQLRALPHWMKLREAHLAGYRQERDLSPAHEALVDSFILLRDVQDLTYFLLERDNPAYSKWTDQMGANLSQLERRLAAAT